MKHLSSFIIQIVHLIPSIDAVCKIKLFTVFNALFLYPWLYSFFSLFAFHVDCDVGDCLAESTAWSVDANHTVHPVGTFIGQPFGLDYGLMVCEAYLHGKMCFPGYVCVDGLLNKSIPGYAFPVFLVRTNLVHLMVYMKGTCEIRQVL